MAPTVDSVSYLEQLLALIKIPATVQSETIVEFDQAEASSNCRLTIDRVSFSDEQVQTIIGTAGANLDALQYLVNLHLNAKLSTQEHTFYTVEIDGYRAKRTVELQELAEQAVAWAKDNGQVYKFQQLSAAERRQVHLYLRQTYPEIESFSEGKEPHRQLIVRSLQIPEHSSDDLADAASQFV
jgi:spoIIIJ-associated protein